MIAKKWVGNFFLVYTATNEMKKLFATPRNSYVYKSGFTNKLMNNSNF